MRSALMRPRLARAHAPDLDAVELGEQRRRQLALSGRLHDHELLLVALLDGHRGHRLDAAQARQDGVVDAEDLDLGDLSLGDAGLQLVGRALAHDLAARDHGDAVAERVRLEHVVRREQHRLPGRDQVGDRLPQLARADRVDADRRLVQEHHLRVVQDPARDVEPLAHSARVALDALLLAALQPDQLEDLVDPRPLRLAGDAVELCEVAEIVARREPLVEPAVAAEDVADPLPHLASVLDDVEAEHPRLARGGEEQRDQHLDRRRLAGPVGAEQAEQLPLAHGERDAAHGLDLQPLPPDDAG